MTNFSEVYRHLRRKNWRQYSLLAGCAFVSVLLITAYACIMRSPTILTVLPEGGDSRKQVMMVFVLAVLGCAVFTIYASGLFFRQICEFRYCVLTVSLLSWYQIIDIVRKAFSERNTSRLKSANSA